MRQPISRADSIDPDVIGSTFMRSDPSESSNAKFGCSIRCAPRHTAKSVDAGDVDYAASLFDTTKLRAQAIEDTFQIHVNDSVPVIVLELFHEFAKRPNDACQ